MSLALIGIADGIGQGSIYGLSGLFSSEYIQAVSAGTGASGFTTSITRAISKSFFPATELEARNGGILFFLISGVLMVIGILAYYVLVRLNLTKFYLRKAGFSRSGDELVDTISTKDQVDVNDIKVLSVFQKLWKTAAMVSGTFVVTLTIIPALVSLIPARDPSYAVWLVTVLIVTIPRNSFIF